MSSSLKYILSRPSADNVYVKLPNGLRYRSFNSKWRRGYAYIVRTDKSIDVQTESVFDSMTRVGDDILYGYKVLIGSLPDRATKVISLPSSVTLNCHPETVTIDTSLSRAYHPTPQVTIPMVCGVRNTNYLTGCQVRLVNDELIVSTYGNPPADFNWSDFTDCEVIIYFHAGPSGLSKSNSNGSGRGNGNGNKK